MRRFPLRSLAELVIALAAVGGLLWMFDRPRWEIPRLGLLGIWLVCAGLILFGLQFVQTKARLIVEGIVGFGIPLTAVAAMPVGDGLGPTLGTGAIVSALGFSLHAYRTKGKWTALFVGTMAIFIGAALLIATVTDGAKPATLRLTALACFIGGVLPAVRAYSAVFLVIAKGIALQLVMVATIALAFAGPSSPERSILALAIILLATFGLSLLFARVEDGDFQLRLEAPTVASLDRLFIVLGGAAGAAFGAVVYAAFSTLGGIQWSDELQKAAAGVGASIFFESIFTRRAATRSVIKFGRLQLLSGMLIFTGSVWGELGGRFFEVTFSSQAFLSTWVVVAPIAGLITYGWARGVDRRSRRAGANGLIAALIAGGLIAGPLYVGVMTSMGGVAPDQDLLRRGLLWPIFGLIGGTAIDRDRSVGFLPPVAVGLMVAAVIELIRLSLFYGELSLFPPLLALGWSVGLAARPLPGGQEAAAEGI